MKIPNRYLKVVIRCIIGNTITKMINGKGQIDPTKQKQKTNTKTKTPEKNGVKILQGKLKIEPYKLN